MASIFSFIHCFLPAMDTNAAHKKIYKDCFDKKKEEASGDKTVETLSFPLPTHLSVSPSIWQSFFRAFALQKVSFCSPVFLVYFFVQRTKLNLNSKMKLSSRFFSTINTGSRSKFGRWMELDVLRAFNW